MFLDEKTYFQYLEILGQIQFLGSIPWGIWSTNPTMYITTKF
jgi:hypothetical protein